ncbi:MAG: L-threonylcarbamoyladenylate synthase [Bacteroidales bacterium]|nr:L-threonylcarbamoyladenylate synthase [Bacteroidales bacterium]
MLKKIYEANPNPRDIEKIVEVLKDGGIVIYPTDTVYGIGCDIHNREAVNRVAQIKRIPLEKANFSIICSDFSHLSDYARSVDNATFKLMKRLLPGPYTFILPASSRVPRFFTPRKKTIGIRIPNNRIILDIVRVLGNPVLTTSVFSEQDDPHELTDPELIYERFRNIVDVVIDGGPGGWVLSTIIDCTSWPPLVVREGAGDISFLNE